MFGIDLITALVIIAVFVVLILVIDLVFTGGGMTSGMMGVAAQCGAAAMSSPYGWILIVAIIFIVLTAFGRLFGAQ